MTKLGSFNKKKIEKTQHQGYVWDGLVCYSPCGRKK